MLGYHAIILFRYALPLENLRSPTFFSPWNFRPAMTPPLRSPMDKAWSLDASHHGLGRLVPVDMSFFCRFVAIIPWLDDFPFIFPKTWIYWRVSIHYIYKFTIDVYRISFCHGNSCFMITTHWAHGQHQGAQFGPNPGYRDDDQAGIRRQKSI